MARQTAWLLALILTCPGALAASTAGAGWAQGQTPRSAGQDANGKDGKPPNDRWKWWLYDRAELGITDRQSAEINAVFETTIPQLRLAREEQDRADDELSRTAKAHQADVATISRLVDRAESARSKHAKMRVLMLYRMHLLLSADQRAKLEVLRARRDAERRSREPDPGHRRKP
jgi:Spy/CpxP family protein refolding chaperone